MKLFRIRGQYITYYNGYIEADTIEEAKKKAQQDNSWIDLDSKLINRLIVNYAVEVQQKESFMDYSKITSQKE